MIRLITSSAAKCRGAGNNRTSRPHVGPLLVCRSMVCCAAALLVLAGPAVAGPKPELKPPSYGYFDFPTCVRYALVHSDTFLQSRLDIQLVSADLKGFHSDLLPTIKLLTAYYVDRATAGDDGSPMYVRMYVEDWNPYLALLKIKGGKIMVDIAKTAHLEKVVQGIATIAKLFYDVDVTNKQIRAQRQSIALLEKKSEYARSRSEQGGGDDIAVRMHQNDLRKGQLELRSLQQRLDEDLASLKVIMGYHPDYHLPLDTRDAANQILGGFDGTRITFADIQAGNLSLRILAKQEQLQSNVVTGAYVALLPQPILLLEAISNQVDRTSGLNISVGFNYTLWDGFERVRNIRKQQMKSQKAEIDRRQRSREFYNKYHSLMSTIDLSGGKETVARENAKLSELSEERASIRFKSGEIQYEEYVQARMDRVKASLESIGALSERVNALIDLATISGGLNRYNAALRH
ncbi:MAG: TolC family protein [Deltaproteobacteria bacterium]|nr:TolC family protein [Deltaproteobacteria bacterium]